MSRRRSKSTEGEDVEKESISTMDDNTCDPTDKFWTLYLKQTRKTDRDMVEDWKGTTDGILIFAGLFSAVVTAFIIESYKSLQPQTDDLTLLAITQLSLQLASITVNGTGSNNSSPVPAFSTDLTHFKPTKTAIWVNIFWFMSLFFSLTCALTSTLVQQWSREYIQSIERYQVPRKRGQVRAHLFQGLTMYKMSGFMDAIPALLHISLFTFFAGLFMMIHPINTTVGVVLFCLFLFGSALYLFTSVIALWYHSYPFSTPLSQWFLRLSKLWRHNRKQQGKLSRLREIAAQSNEEALLEAYSYVLMAANEDHEFDELLEVLPEFYAAQKNPKTLTKLLDEFYLNQGVRIKQLLDEIETVQGHNRDKKVINSLNFVYTTARLPANPSFTITYILPKLADFCCDDYLNDANMYISNLAFAVAAHATLATRETPLISQPECNLTMTQIVDVLSPLRAYQLPSLSRTFKEKVPSTRPFDYIIICFHRHYTLRGICPQVYYMMLQTQNLGTDAAFVEIARIFLMEICRDQLNADTKEVLDNICTFLCHLEDEKAVKSALDVVRNVAQTYPHISLNAVMTKCQHRLAPSSKNVPAAVHSVLATPPQDDPHAGYSQAGGFGSSINNRSIKGMHKYRLSDEPGGYSTTTPDPSPPHTLSHVPVTSTPAGIGPGQNRHSEMFSITPFNLSLPPNAPSPGVSPGQSPNPPGHIVLPPGAVPPHPSEGISSNPLGAVTPGSAAVAGPRQPQHTGAYTLKAGPIPIPRPAASEASQIYPSSSGASYKAGYMPANRHEGEDDDESDHHGSYSGNRSSSGIARSRASASRGAHRKDRTDHDESSRLVG